MPRYNLVYYPFDDAFAKACVAYAQDNFAGNEDDYLLDGKTALPHVTVCQFNANESQIEEIWTRARLVCTAKPSLMPTKLYFQPGTDHVWVGVKIDRDPALIKWQEQAVEVVRANGGEPITSTGDTYFPHLTFASLKTVPAAKDFRMPGEEILGRSQPFYLVLGESHESGALGKKLHSTLALSPVL